MVDTGNQSSIKELLSGGLLNSVSMNFLDSIIQNDMQNCQKKLDTPNKPIDVN